MEGQSFGSPRLENLVGEERRAQIMAAKLFTNGKETI